jgi:hypothetical protein
MTWTWRYQNELGQPVELTDIDGIGEVHQSQSDAETWLGEHWRELFDAGVTEVSLIEDERVEYVMALTAAE